MSERTASIERRTAETTIDISVNLDGTGQFVTATGVGMFDHMLSHIAKHGVFDLEVRASGDLHIDQHHTIEDCGIALGEAFALAVGNKAGLVRAVGSRTAERRPAARAFAAPVAGGWALCAGTGQPDHLAVRIRFLIEK